MKNILNCVLLLFTKLIYKKKKRWVFGSWFGNQFSDNSKWLYFYVLRNHKDIEVIWITKSKNEEDYIKSIGGKAMIYDTMIANFYVLTADCVFMTQGYKDLSDTYLIGGAYKVQLWHGVALKRIGKDALKTKKLSIFRTINRFFFNLWYKCDLYISPSEEFKAKLASAFDLNNDDIIINGQPRNDVLFSCDDIMKSEILNKISDKECFDLRNRKIITYMPTFRDKSSYFFDFSELEDEDLEKLNHLLKRNNAIIIQKKHFVNNQNSNKEKMDENILCINEIDTQELLLCTDLLITDYSSCYFDFLILDRPIIHFVYDYIYYKEQDRGLYYRLEDVCGGRIAYNFKDLLIDIDDYLSNKNIDLVLRERTRKKFITFENGNSSEEIIKYILNKKY